MSYGFLLLILRTNYFFILTIMIYPFIRANLDILFVGLNPAETSSKKGHYFSTRPNFWNQLYEAGLITESVNMNEADEKVFGSSEINHNGWQYGVTDLVNFWAESDSSEVKPTEEHCKELLQNIRKYKPKVVILLHSKVIKHFVKKHLNENARRGYLGKLLDGCNTVFYNVPFPHGNSIPSSEKIELYKEIKDLLEKYNC